MIQPHFNYCNVVWRSCGIRLADKLQKLHNRALQALIFSSYDADASQLFQKLNWKSLSTQRDIQKALRADVSKYRPEVYKSEKSQNLQKIHKVALGKLLT